MKNLQQRIEDYIKYCKLKGLDGGVVMSEDAVYESFVSIHNSVVQQCLDALGEGKEINYKRPLAWEIHGYTAHLKESKEALLKLKIE